MISLDRTIKMNDAVTANIPSINRNTLANLNFIPVGNVTFDCTAHDDEY